MTPEPSTAAQRHRDRARGALIGLAVGDALGTTLEFKLPGTFVPLTDMVGGGPFALKPGEWTDDTSMALCLAESLLACDGFDAADQMRRYLRWYREGHLSVTGECFDIGNTIRAALQGFEQDGNPWQGATDPNKLANGSLMRLAPVPVFYANAPADAVRLAAESSRTTHGAPLVLDCCRYAAALMVGAIQGASKAELLTGVFGEAQGWYATPLHPELREIALGSYRTRKPPEIRGSGKVTHALEAALWAFFRSDDFRTGCLTAVNLGEDADTTGAIYGQLAGAYYGESGIPAGWREMLAGRDLLDPITDGLAARLA